MMVKKVICGLCACNCILKAHCDKEGLLPNIKGDENSITGGFSCIKGRSIAKIARSKNRLQTPLLKKPSGEFVPITIDEALDRLAEEMLTIKKDFGPSAFAFHSGQAGVRRQFSRLTAYTAKLFGSVNYSGIGATCNISKRLAYHLTLGAFPKCNYKKAKTIVLWGHNAPHTHPYDWHVINSRCNQKAKLIIIDPQKTPACRSGVLHLPLIPGTDIYLAWAMLKIAVDNKWQQSALEDKLKGLPELIDALNEFDAVELCRICGLAYENVHEATRRIMKEKPATIMVGTAVELQRHGFQAARAIALLQALAGLEALAFCPKPSYKQFPVQAHGEGTMVGSSQYPLFTEFAGYAQSNLLLKSIENNDVKGLLVVGGNPLLTWTDAARNKEAFSRLQFLAVMDNFLTATAKEADLIIPAASPGEKYELIECISSEGDVYINLSEPILPPLAINEVEFFKGLAERLGFGHAMPWNNSWEFFNYLLEPLQLDCEKLLETPNGSFYASGMKWEDLKNGWDGINIVAPTLKAYGHQVPPVPPKYSVPAENKVILTTCDKPKELVHTRYRSVDSLAKNHKPVIKLASRTARKHGIKTGDMVEVSRNNYCLIAEARVSDDVIGADAVLGHGWEELNVNAFTSLAELDAVTGFPHAVGIEVTIKKYRG
ncbi:MAG: molybdopterin-containing oxidoreductase family protein [Bacillota bacterium]|jgi:anaerobic selenocysteine-containing dehydrogenase